MKYQVPQFIEVEDKIFGPLTLKQFLYVAGGAAFGFIIWSAIPVKVFAIIVAAPIVVFFLAMAFYKVNERPFVNLVENSIRYAFGTKRYTWHKKEKAPTPINPENAANSAQSNIDSLMPKLSDSKLKELTWSLDINEKLGNSQTISDKFKV